MSFKLNGAPYNKDNMNIAVYRKDLKDGSAGKSNHTGIIVDKDVSPEMEKAVIAHETVHQHQQRNGELDYDKENFYWKGKTYPRENLNEHNENLPWEKEAYAKSNGILNGKQEDMKERFQLKGYRGNNKPFKTMSDRGLIGAQDDGASIKRKGKYISTQYTKSQEGQKVEPSKEEVSKVTTVAPKQASTHTMTTTFPGGKKNVKTTIIDPANPGSTTDHGIISEGETGGVTKGAYKKKAATRVHEVGKIKKNKGLSKLTRAEGKGDAYEIKKKRKVEVSSPTRTDKAVFDDDNKIVGKERINQPSTYTFTKYKGAQGKEKVKKFVAKEDQGKGDYKAEEGTKVKSRKALERKTKKFANYKSNKIGQGDKKLARGSYKGSYETNKRDNKLTYEKRAKALISGEEGKKFIQKKRKKVK
tara:strand:- start:741 stop:1988 length:1248 start_codon:yes stop_codon:yes gene_type:complete